MEFTHAQAHHIFSTACLPSPSSPCRSHAWGMNAAQACWYPGSLRTLKGLGEAEWKDSKGHVNIASQVETATPGLTLPHLTTFVLEAHQEGLQAQWELSLWP